MLSGLVLMMAQLTGDPLFPNDPAPAWSIVEGDACTAVRTYPNGTRVALLWDSYTGSGGLVVSRPTWTSLEQGQTVPLEVTFDPYTPWTFKAEAVRASTGFGGVVASFENRLFMTEFMQADRLVLRTGRDLIGEFPMDGSFKAAVALGDCNARMARRVKDDPFGD